MTDEVKEIYSNTQYRVTVEDRPDPLDTEKDRSFYVVTATEYGVEEQIALNAAAAIEYAMRAEQELLGLFKSMQQGFSFDEEEEEAERATH